MQATTKEWILKTVSRLPEKDIESLKDYVEFLVWKSKQQQSEPKLMGKNPIAQRIIKAMEKPPHLTYDDVAALLESIEDGKMPVKYDSLFEEDEQEEK